MKYKHCVVDGHCTTYTTQHTAAAVAAIQIVIDICSLVT